jgi:hypothetical protein
MTSDLLFSMLQPIAIVLRQVPVVGILADHESVPVASYL